MAAPERGERGGGEDRPHRDHAPDRKRRGGGEQQGVDDVGRAGEPKPADMQQNREQQPAADPAMRAPGLARRQARQQPRRQQRLHEQKRQLDDPREARRDVDRIAPGQQRAGGGDGDRRRDRRGERRPDQRGADR